MFVDEERCDAFSATANRAGAPHSLVTLLSPDGTGGARVALEYASALVSQGANVVMVHGPASREPRRAARFLDEVRAAGIVPFEEPGLARPPYPALIGRLAALARSSASRCIIGVNQRDRVAAVDVARRAGLPCILCGLNEHRFHGTRPIALLKHRLYARRARRAALVVCSSETVRAEFVEDMGVDPARTALLPHGIEIERGHDADPDVATSLRTEFGVATGTPLITTIGRIDPQKGMDLLIDALALVPGFDGKLVVVGSVSDSASRTANEAHRRDLASAVVRHGLVDRVTFAGWRDDYREILRASDVYVHPARHEGLPLTVLSAMEASRALLVADNASRPPGFLDGLHGRTFEPGNVTALAAGLHELLTMGESDRRRFGKEARRLVEERYDMHRIRENFVALVRDVIARATPSRTIVTDRTG